MKKNSIVVFGGSFNPPLNSHFSIAEQILNQFEEVEKIVFVPVNRNYSKDGLVDNEHRYNMLKLVVNKNDKFIISDIDLHREKSLPTIETLEEIQKQFSDKGIYFIIGSDNLKEIHTWVRAEELISKYKILVMERDKDNIDEIIQNIPLLKRYKINIEKINQEIKSNYNSTYVRTQIKNKKSVRYLMPDEVYEYIEQNKLYRE